MKNNWRYEIKFILDESHLNSAMQWLQLHTSARQAYPERYVNSLYYDDVDYQSVRDNLSGVSERRKQRLRWYSETQTSTPEQCVIEIKKRSGRLGAKNTHPVHLLENNLYDLELKNITDIIFHKEQANEVTAQLLDNYYMPTLFVNYLRSYYADIEGLRITFDHGINFRPTLMHRKLLDQTSIKYPHTIMELKFPPELKPHVVHLLKPLHFIPKRHSKYLAGLASFGQALYY